MYGKVFGAFFDSSINDADPITRLVFIAMIVLSDRNGQIDMTRQALARRVNVSLAEIDTAIELLSQPDPISRSADHEGRRIVPIDPSRTWGWIVVNKTAYRGSSDEEKRQQARERKRRQRDRDRGRDTKSDGSFDSSSVERVTDTNTDTGRHAPSLNGHAMSREERDARFNRTWERVPRKEGKTAARRHYVAAVKTASDADRFDRGVDGYLRKIAAERTEPRFYVYGSTLFSNIEDFVDWQPTKAAVPTAALGTHVPLGGVA